MNGLRTLRAPLATHGSAKTLAHRIHSPSPPLLQTWAMTVIFGGVQIVSSQVPNLESAWWVSFIGVLTSLFYASVALVLGMIHGEAPGAAWATRIWLVGAWVMSVSLEHKSSWGERPDSSSSKTREDLLGCPCTMSLDCTP